MKYEYEYIYIKKGTLYQKRIVTQMIHTIVLYNHAKNGKILRAYRFKEKA